MPYVDRGRRKELDRGRPPLSSGELTYLLTQVAIEPGESMAENMRAMVDEYLASRPRRASFQDLCDCLGALEATWREFRRRVWPEDEFRSDAHAARVRVDDVIRSCRRVQAELYSEVVAPYEDEKIKINGDVFPGGGRA